MGLSFSFGGGEGGVEVWAGYRACAWFGLPKRPCTYIQYMLRPETPETPITQ